MAGFEKREYKVLECIRSIPSALRELSGFEREIAEVAEEIAKSGREIMYVTGCGTRYFVSVAVAYILSKIAKVPAFAVPSNAVLDNPPPNLAKSVLVAFSHSGITKATREAVQEAKRLGSMTIGVTYFKGRPIEELADKTLVLPNPEPVEPKTRTYVTDVACGIFLALHLASRRNVPVDVEAYRRGLFDEVPKAIEQILAQEQLFAKVARETKDLKHYLAGGGVHYATALEAALKLKEIAMVHAEGYEIEEITHGPPAVFGKPTAVTVIAAPGRNVSRALDVLKAAKLVEAYTIAVTSPEVGELAETADFAIKVPGPTNEILTALTYIVPLQLIAYYAAVEKNVYPDSLSERSPVWYKVFREIIFPPGTH